MRRFVDISLRTMIESFISIMEVHSPYTQGHSRRVAELSVELLERVAPKEVYDEMRFNMELLGYLHDVGKILIDENILNKTDDLTEMEWETIKQHPLISYRILRSISSVPGTVAEGALKHHKLLDGSGYPEMFPDGIEDEIPFMVRILTIVDIWDALTTSRPYRTQEITELRAISIITEQVVLNQLDKAIFEEFINLIEEKTYGLRE